MTAEARAAGSARRGRGLGLLLIVAVGFCTVTPVLYVFLHSFDLADIGDPFVFGTAGWEEIFGSRASLNAIGYSFLLALRLPIAIFVAFLVSWLIVRVDLPGRRFIEYTLWFAYFLPAVPITMGWILLLDRDYGLINQALLHLPFIHEAPFSIYSIPGIIWVHITLNTIPVMVILLTPALRQLDASHEEAAEMSGAGLWSIFRRITLPLIAPALLVAFIAGLVKSLEMFEVEQLLGVPARIYVYATRIYDLVSWHPPDYPQAMALGAIFLALMLMIACVYQYYLARIGSRPSIAGKGVRTRVRARSPWAYAASGAIMLYLAIGVFLPLAVLVLGSFTRLFGFFFMDDPWTTEHWSEVLTDPNFGTAVLNSLLLGIAVAGIGTLTFALLAWGIARRHVRYSRVLSLLTWLPWAVPGLLLGIGLLAVMLETPGLSLLYGTLVPLALAMIIKEMPIGVQMLQAALTQVSEELEQAALISGAGLLTTFRLVTLPLIAPMLVAVFMFVFVATIRDIGTVVLLATPGTQTLSLLMFQFAVANRFEGAAVLGVLIALLSLMVTSLVVRIGANFGLGR